MLHLNKELHLKYSQFDVPSPDSSCAGSLLRRLASGAGVVSLLGTVDSGADSGATGVNDAQN